MANRKSKRATKRENHRTVYAEFGCTQRAALERGVEDVSPQQQTLKVQASRKGRKGKTVTVISGFQHKPETLSTLAKTLKTQCGTGGTVKDETIEIQGEHTHKLLQLLQSAGYKTKQ